MSGDADRPTQTDSASAARIQACHAAGRESHGLLAKAINDFRKLGIRYLAADPMDNSFLNPVRKFRSLKNATWISTNPLSGKRQPSSAPVTTLLWTTGRNE